MGLKEIINALSDIEKLKSTIIKIVIPSGLFYLVAIFIFYSQGFTILQIIRDVPQQLKVSSFLGFLVNIGIGFWVAAVSICFFLLLSDTIRIGKERRKLILLTGLLSLLLAVDDFFMIHDRFINQYLCYLVYAIIAITILVKYHDLILKIHGISFLFSGFFLMMSILTDIFQGYFPISYTKVQVFEEGFKFIGIASWLYFVFKLGSYNLDEEKEILEK